MVNSNAWQEPKIPYNVELGEAVLGALLAAPSISPVLRSLLKPNDFGITAHKTISEAAYAIEDEGSTSNELTVISWLERHDMLAKAGGAEGVAPLSTIVPPEYPTVSSNGHINFWRTQSGMPSTILVAPLCRQVSIH